MNNMTNVGADECIEAFNKLTYKALALYLYLASSNDGDVVVMDDDDAMEFLGMTSEQFANAFIELIAAGYIQIRDDGTFDFSTTPINY